MMTLAQFSAAMQCTPDRAAAWYEPFIAAMAEHGINTPRQMAMFLAQVGHESGGLVRLEENLNYSAQRLCDVWPTRFQSVADAHYYEHAPERLANHVYASRNGNGDEESGDGWRYRGRGPIQITFRANYERAGTALALPLLDQPELLLQPAEGAHSAAWFWVDKGCGPYADADNIATVTRLINGGREGLAQRIERYERALQVLA
jgi:putative chitinase